MLTKHNEQVINEVHCRNAVGFVPLKTKTKNSVFSSKIQITGRKRKRTNNQNTELEWSGSWGCHARTSETLLNQIKIQTSNKI